MKAYLFLLFALFFQANGKEPKYVPYDETDSKKFLSYVKEDGDGFLALRVQRQKKHMNNEYFFTSFHRLYDVNYRSRMTFEDFCDSMIVKIKNNTPICLSPRRAEKFTIVKISDDDIREANADQIIDSLFLENHMYKEYANPQTLEPKVMKQLVILFLKGYMFKTRHSDGRLVIFFKKKPEDPY